MTAKRVIMLDEAVCSDSILLNYRSFQKSVVIEEDGKYYYQNIKLKPYNKTIQYGAEVHNTSALVRLKKTTYLIGEKKKR